MFQNDCLACDVVKGKIRTPGGIIYENDYWMVDHSTSPVLLPGFLIIKTKRHCEHLAELSIPEMTSFARVLRITCIALSRVMSPAKIYTCSFGESVKHIHFYVIPRSTEMPTNGLEVLQKMFFEKAWASDDNKAIEITIKIKDEFQRLLQEPMEDKP